MNSLFEIVNERFFSPLSSKNKEINIMSLFILEQLIDELDMENKNKKSIIEKVLADELESKLDIRLFDDEENEEIIGNYLDKAKYIINTFINTGWMYKEAVENYEYSLNFYEYSTNMLQLLRQIRDNTKTEYSGLLFTIHSLMKNFDFKEIEKLTEIQSNTKRLVLNLKSLRSNINRYYTHILENKTKLELNDLLRSLLVDYKADFFDSAYYKLRSKDFPKYRVDIIDRLNKMIESANLPLLIRAYADIEKTSFSDAEKK